jgi:hypothetical protein
MSVTGTLVTGDELVDRGSRCCGADRRRDGFRCRPRSWLAVEAASADSTVGKQVECHEAGVEPRRISRSDVPLTRATNVSVLPTADIVHGDGPEHLVR